MFKCRDCKNIFREPREIIGGYVGERLAECPYCGRTDFDEAKRCDECGEWFLLEELNGGYCNECLSMKVNFDNVLEYAKKYNDVDNFIDSIITSTEKTEILLKIAREKTMLSKKNLVEYAMEDAFSFGNFIKSKETCNSKESR